MRRLASPRASDQSELRVAMHADVHLEAWLSLSKEGQEMYVREWARDSMMGAVSHRKDVAPHKDHLADMPDFAKASQYVWVSTSLGGKDIDEATKLFKQIAEK